MIHVPELLPDQEVPKEKLIEKLTEEGPHFMYSLMNAELPEAMGRFVCRGRRKEKRTCRRQTVGSLVGEKNEFASSLGVVCDHTIDEVYKCTAKADQRPCRRTSSASNCVRGPRARNCPKSRPRRERNVRTELGRSTTDLMLCRKKRALPNPQDAEDGRRQAEDLSLIGHEAVAAAKMAATLSMVACGS